MDGFESLLKNEKQKEMTYIQRVVMENVCPININMLRNNKVIYMDI